MTKPWQERVSEGAKKLSSDALTAVTNKQTLFELEDVGVLIGQSFCEGANWARAETLRELEPVIEAAKEVQKVYGNDSNGIHQKLYEALSTFERIKLESEKV